ncbi:MAG: hypothetical protein ABIP77_02290 [Candidatus Limnocylindrales bacterium]
MDREKTDGAVSGPNPKVRTDRPKGRSAAFLGKGLIALVALATIVTPTLAADPEIIPAPPSIGAAVPLTYFGPAPSQVQKELVGPVKLLRSGTIDEVKGTTTIPIYKGQTKNNKEVWYILTDTDDEANAAALGLNFSAKLSYGDVAGSARTATLQKDQSLTFEKGAVDFEPVQKLVPGAAPDFFPPKSAQPGSVGDKDYSPLVKVTNAGGHIYNAPIIAFGIDEAKLGAASKAGAVDHSIVHDKVLSIDTKARTVTLQLTSGFSFAKPVLYLSLDASDPGVATMEGATYAPGLNNLTVGHDDSAFSPVERLFAFPNGPTGKANPQRQGFNSALSGEGGPLNVLGGIPTVATDYSPLWDVNLGVWTADAIAKGYRSRIIDEFQLLGIVEDGWITGPGGSPFGSVGVIVNCPIVLRFL